MKIPKEIIGKNRLRDLHICTEYCNGKTIEEIIKACTLKIKPRRVYKVIYDNAKFIESRIGWDKSKRLHTLQRIATSAGIYLSPKKDILNVLEQMRKEIEGDKPLIDNSIHVTGITIDNGESNRIKNNPNKLPSRISI